MREYPVIRNGSLIEDGAMAVPAWDRSFHFGDGFFESFRAIERSPLFLEDHLDRSKRGMERMGIVPPEEWTADRIKRDIARLLDHLDEKNARIRLTVTRDGSGAYSPEEDGGNYLIERTGPCSDRFELSAKGSAVGIPSHLRKSLGPLSPFKCTSASLYVMAQKWARKEGLDEALIQGMDGRILESASSNIFLLSGYEAVTPPLDDGCVDGIMRRKLIQLMGELGWRIRERSLMEEDLKRADEFLLVNAVQGIRPVTAFQDQRYFKTLASQWVQALNRRVVN